MPKKNCHFFKLDPEIGGGDLDRVFVWSDKEPRSPGNFLTSWGGVSTDAFDASFFIHQSGGT